MKYLLKYNKLKIDVEIMQRIFQKELTEKLLKINDLELQNREYKKRLTEKNKLIKELKENLKEGA